MLSWPQAVRVDPCPHCDAGLASLLPPEGDYRITTHVRGRCTRCKRWSDTTWNIHLSAADFHVLDTKRCYPTAAELATKAANGGMALATETRFKDGTGVSQSLHMFAPWAMSRYHACQTDEDRCCCLPCLVVARPTVVVPCRGRGPLAPVVPGEGGGFRYLPRSFGTDARKESHVGAYLRAATGGNAGVVPVQEPEPAPANQAPVQGAIAPTATAADHGAAGVPAGNPGEFQAFIGGGPSNPFRAPSRAAIHVEDVEEHQDAAGRPGQGPGGDPGPRPALVDEIPEWLGEAIAADATGLLPSLANYLATFSQPPGFEYLNPGRIAFGRALSEQDQRNRLLMALNESYAINTDGPIVQVAMENGNEIGVEATQLKSVACGPYVHEIRNVYSNTNTNMADAIDRRITQKKKPYRLSAEQKRDISRIVDALCANGGLYSTKKILDVVNRVLWEPNFADLKSRKWSNERMVAAVEKLWATMDLEFSLDCFVKTEAQTNSKPARPIKNDGDVGQVMSLLVIAIFDLLTYEEHKCHAIKHKTKEEALKDVVDMFQGKLYMTATDGSAWDASCKHEIRDLIENRILFHIMEVVMDLGYVPEQWLQKHQEVNEKKKLRLRFRRKCFKDNIYHNIEAIRRSGHRGTSSLNWIVNVVLTLYANFPVASCITLLNQAQTRRVVSRWSDKKIWFSWACDGDDMFYGMSHCHTPEQRETELALWDAAGFTMKVNQEDNGSFRRFLGHMFGLKNRQEGTGLNGIVLPELLRNLNASHVHCSARINRILETEGLSAQCIREFAPGFVCRANAFKDFLPGLASKYLELACHLMGEHDVLLSHDHAMRLGVEDDSSTSEQIAKVSQHLWGGTAVDLDTLNTLGMTTTPEQWSAFLCYPWEQTGVFDIGPLCPSTWM